MVVAGALGTNGLVIFRVGGALGVTDVVIKNLDNESGRRVSQTFRT